MMSSQQGRGQGRTPDEERKESQQEVVHRSLLYSQLLILLMAASVGLLAYAVLQANAHLPVRLLDVQSATAAVVATGGAALARGQYARASRPMIGWFGRVVTDVAPGQQPVWSCDVYNGQDVCTVTEVRYQVMFARSARKAGARDMGEWKGVDDAIDVIEARGLRHREDFHLDFIERGRPLPGKGRMFVGWFNKSAMQEVEEVLVRVRALDRPGDTHQRVVALLKGADRDPRHPGPAPF